MVKNLKVKSFGPIAEADVNFGDLTLLVGPQASGKSLFVQLLKLLKDTSSIRFTLKSYSYVWNVNIDTILDLYFGEGMSKIWKKDTEINFDNKLFNDNYFLLGGKEKYEEPIFGPSINDFNKFEPPVEAEKVFYIPAQRILSIYDGRPKTFMEFDTSTPYVLREFSDNIRHLFQYIFVKEKVVFPTKEGMSSLLINSFNDSIFHDSKVVIDERSGQKKLRMVIDNQVSVPFITWSAGQKEFMPLLMSFYKLSSIKENYEIVVIEEPEMGLHPQAIKSVILQVIDLMSRGYQVIISTHSPVLLEFAWAFNLLKKHKVKDAALAELFDIKNASSLFENILSEKVINTYYFSREANKGVVVKDISDLDAGSDDEAMAEWGGISQFSTRVTDVVSKYLNDEE